MTDIVQHVSRFRGVDGCVIGKEDGTILAGTLPEGQNDKTLHAFAPHLLKKVSRYIEPLQLGHIKRFTVTTNAKPMSIFKAGAVVMVLTHPAPKLLNSVLKRGVELTEELSKSQN